MEVSELQVDRYVAAARRRLGEVQAFVPLVADAGVEATVDWGQAQVILRGKPAVAHIFLMRACHSGASFAMAFQSEIQQASWRATCMPWPGLRGCSRRSAMATWAARCAGVEVAPSRCVRTTCLERNCP